MAFVPGFRLILFPGFQCRCEIRRIFLNVHIIPAVVIISAFLAVRVYIFPCSCNYLRKRRITGSNIVIRELQILVFYIMFFIVVMTIIILRSDRSPIQSEKRIFAVRILYQLLLSVFIEIIQFRKVIKRVFVPGLPLFPLSLGSYSAFQLLPENRRKVRKTAACRKQTNGQKDCSDSLYNARFFSHKTHFLTRVISLCGIPEHVLAFPGTAFERLCDKRTQAPAPQQCYVNAVKRKSQQKNCEKVLISTVFNTFSAV